MKDQISIERCMKLHPAIRFDVMNAITKAEVEKFQNKIAVRVVQGLRTFPEQQALYEQGRTKPGKIVTNSKAGQSYHNYGLAIDFALLYDLNGDGSFESLSWDTLKDIDKDGEADWLEVVDVFESQGYTWGGRFQSIKDNPHFEKNFGIHWKELLKRYEAKDFIQDVYVKI